MWHSNEQQTHQAHHAGCHFKLTSVTSQHNRLATVSDCTVKQQWKVTFWHFRHTAWLNPERGLPLLGCTSAAVLLILGAAELPFCFGLLTAVSAHADDPLQAQQEDAAVAIAHHNDLQSKCLSCLLAADCFTVLHPRCKVEAHFAQQILSGLV